MLLVISPAKNLDYDTPLPLKKHSKPAFLADSEELIKSLRKLAPQDIAKLMGISDKLAVLNYDRFKAWSQPFTPANSRQAVLAFKGDVYIGLNAYEFSAEDFTFAQEHLRILSGLYGVLKPLDLMQAYRLEMGKAISNKRGKNLYEFWGSKITDNLNKQLKKLQTNTLLNLASNEYFKSVESANVQAEIINPVFKDWKNGQYKVISFFAKKARGQMGAYIIKNKITEVSAIKKFKEDGYRYNASLSKGNDWVFTRKQ